MGVRIIIDDSFKIHWRSIEDPFKIHSISLIPMDEADGNIWETLIYTAKREPGAGSRHR